MKAIAAYVPALHEGYRTFFEKHSAAGAKSLYVAHQSIVAEVDHLRKDLRALASAYSIPAIRAWEIFKVVNPLYHETIEQLISRKAEIIMPDEEISRHIGRKYFSGLSVTYDTVFLRRDQNRVLAKEAVRPDRTISTEQFDQEMMTWAVIEGEKSSDWWRRVGGILVRDGEILLVAHNEHLPNENSPGILGDSRSNFKKGLHFELVDTIHAEAAIISRAADSGVSTRGTSLYVTDFPCPFCAKIIAFAGIKRLFYATGYAMLEGEDILKSAGVEIIFVQPKSPSLP